MRQPPHTGDADTGPESGDSLRSMTLLEHLDELRRRLFRCLMAVAVGFAVSYAYHEEIFQWLARPLTRFLPEGGQLVYLKLQEPFMLFLKVALFAGIFIAAPFLLWQLWLFISPGLYRHEKRYALPFIVFASALFIAGCAFAYFVALPSAFQFFIDMGKGYTPNIDIDFFFDLVLFIILGMGAVFQLPIVIAFLSMMGMVTPRFLVQKFRHAVVLIFIVAAVISPTTDALNLVIFAVPMLVLYIVSIGVSWIFARRRARGDAAGAAAA
jgi:sec-independent protein translocase protein TatC